jgi:hypothetical protein
MKRLIIAVVVIMTSCGSAWSAEQQNALAQDNTPQKEIESSIRQFFASLSKRDVKGMQNVLDVSLVGIEAAGTDAGIHVLDATKPEDIFPPQGNHKLDKVRLSDAKVQVSSTHPSVATISFTLLIPIDAEKVARLEDLLKDSGTKLSDSRREQFAKIIKERAVSNSMFAMLAHRNGAWRIICMSLPK